MFEIKLFLFFILFFLVVVLGLWLIESCWIIFDWSMMVLEFLILVINKWLLLIRIVVIVVELFGFKLGVWLRMRIFVFL